MTALKWTGTGTGIAGAIWVALNITTSGWGFVLFAVSAISWAAAGWLMREPSLITLHSVFLVVKILGIYRWLIA